MKSPQPPSEAAPAWGSPARGATPGPVLWRDGGAGAGAGAGAGPAGEEEAEAALPPSWPRKQRCLSPLWEEELELATAEPAGQNLDGLFPDLLRQVSRALGCVSPETPLFRSFFAEECLAIVSQLQPAGPELSAIEAEPLPLDNTDWALCEASPAREPQGAASQQRLAEGPGAQDPSGQSSGAPADPPSAAGGAVSEDAGLLGELTVLQTLALNLTVELQGSSRSSASIRQLTFEVSAANPLGATVTLPLEREHLAEQSSFRHSALDDPEPSKPAAGAQELEVLSNESSVSLGSSSFATSTPLMGPAKFHFMTGSPLGTDLGRKDPNSSRRSVSTDRRCFSQAGSSAARKGTQSAGSERRILPEEEPCGKVCPRPPRKSAVLPVGSRFCASTKGQAAVKSLLLASSTPRASRSLVLSSSGSRRTAELLRADLPPRDRGIHWEGKASQRPLSNSQPSLQKAAAQREAPQGCSADTQSSAQLPASSTEKRSATKLPCSAKCPSSLQPPARLPRPGGSSKPLLTGSRVSLGSGIPSVNKGTGAPSIKLSTHPGTRLRLKPRPSSLQAPCSLPAGHPGVKASLRDKETESVIKPGCNKPSLRRAASAVTLAMAPRSRLRPTGRKTASHNRRSSPRPAPEGTGGMAQPQTGGNSPAPQSSLPDCAVESGGSAPSLQLPGELLAQELQRTRSELQRVKNELAARDAQCEAYRRTIISQQQTICTMEAQLRAGSLMEGEGVRQDCALEGE